MPRGGPEISLPLLTPAFARALRGRMWGLGALTVCLFAVASGLLLHGDRRQSLSEHGAAWEAVFQPVASEAVIPLFDRLRGSSPQLAGVAFWEGDAESPRLYPDEPALRAAVRRASGKRDEVGLVSAPLWGSARSLAVVPISSPPQVGMPPRRLAVILRTPSLFTSWLLSTVVFAIFVFFAVHVGTRVIVRWFDRRIARPLRDAADLSTSLDHVEEAAPHADPEAHTITRTVERYRHMARALVRARAEARRAEEDMERKLRKHQEGFHRELRRAEDKALIDPLTRLYNRAYMELELERLYKEQRDKKDDLSLVMLDVDHFKFHNDTQGHKAGDDVLRFIGDLLRGATRPTDRCIRYGGDEFIMLLPGCPAKAAAEIAERIVRLFRQFASTLQSEKPPSLSAGIASLGTDSTSTGLELLGFADRNLYAVKRRGKNAVAVSMEEGVRYQA